MFSLSVDPLYYYKSNTLIENLKGRGYRDLFLFKNEKICYNLLVMRIIDKEIVEKILTLSRLYLKEDEKDEIIPQLEEILSHFKVIDKIDTKNIEPMFHPPIQKLYLREDKNIKTFNREVLESISPDFENGFVKVPKIVGE